MTRFRTIEIDLDVHKAVEAGRRGFDETDNDVIRRLLGLGSPGEDAQQHEGRAWIGDGVHLPHGTVVRMTHQRGRQIYEGQILDGKWHINGQIFGSPSGAASALAITSKGGKTNLNGWSKWEAKRPQDADWVPLTTLRRGNRPLTPLTLEDLSL